MVIEKLFAVRCEIGDGVPDYKFIVFATDIHEATRRAEYIANLDYPEHSTVSLEEMTPEQYIKNQDLTWVSDTKE